jgi:hypothetical protein
VGVFISTSLIDESVVKSLVVVESELTTDEYVVEVVSFAPVVRVVNSVSVIVRCVVVVAVVVAVVVVVVDTSGFYKQQSKKNQQSKKKNEILSSPLVDNCDCTFLSCRNRLVWYKARMYH